MAHGSTARDATQLGWELSLANEQSVHAVDPQRLLAAARRVLEDSPYRAATISIAVVDDATIHELNCKYLAHDYPTDVLSFVLDARDGYLNGEIILSAETAARAASEAGWSAGDEQLLYVIHGMLHFMSYSDHSDADRRRMRDAEKRYLSKLGVTLFNGPHWDELENHTGGVGGTSAW